MHIHFQLLEGTCTRRGFLIDSSGSRIFLIWSLGFGILEQNRGQIWNWKHAWERDAKNNPRDYGISRNFGSELRDWRTLLGTLPTDLSCISYRVGHNYQKTKSTELNVVLPAVRTKFIKKSIIYRGQARTYNELPDVAKLLQFKKMLRTVILYFCCIVYFSSICHFMFFSAILLYLIFI